MFLLAAVPTSYCFTANDANKVISSNGSLSDTQAAVTYVAAKNADGWVLTVGSAGISYTWASTLTISIPHVFTIQGASPSNRPTITSTYTGSAGIGLGCTNGKTITIKDLKFNGWSASNTLFMVSGSGVDCYRFTNLEFTGTPRWCIWVSSVAGSGGEGPYGLIDHCTWPNGGCGVFARDNPLSNPNSWHRPMSWGTKKAVYVEDCTFYSTSNVPTANVAVDGDNGERIVFRHNNVTNFLFGTHGADSPGPINSALQHEVMHNTFTVVNNTAQDTAIQIRGGTLVAFDNTFNRTGTSEYNSGVKLMYFRATSGGGSVCVQDRFYPQDYLGTQQPGMGVIVGATSQDPHYPSEPWVSVPIYCWGNHINAPMRLGEIAGNGNGFIVLNRDYFKSPKPGYTEFTYPHPLQATPSAPSPPSNLRVTSGP